MIRKTRVKEESPVVMIGEVPVTVQDSVGVLANQITEGEVLDDEALALLYSGTLKMKELTEAWGKPLDGRLKLPAGVLMKLYRSLVDLALKRFHDSATRGIHWQKEVDAPLPIDGTGRRAVRIRHHGYQRRFKGTSAEHMVTVHTSLRVDNDGKPLLESHPDPVGEYKRVTAVNGTAGSVQFFRTRVSDASGDLWFDHQAGKVIDATDPTAAVVANKKDQLTPQEVVLVRLQLVAAMEDLWTYVSAPREAVAPEILEDVSRRSAPRRVQLNE